MIKKEKGITLVTLMITVMIMSIIGVTLATNAYDGVALSKITKLDNDIKIIKDRVAVYYVKNDELPIKETEYTKENLEATINDLSDNDGDKYYVIDLDKLDNITLNYGNNSTEYIINEESHVIYYLPGIVYRNVTYHTIGDNSQVINHIGNSLE